MTKAPWECCRPWYNISRPWISFHQINTSTADSKSDIKHTHLHVFLRISKQCTCTFNLRKSLITARKRSLGKVMFLHLSVCSQGRGVCIRPTREVYLQGVCIHRVCLQGACIQRGLPTGGLHPWVWLWGGVCIQVGSSYWGSAQPPPGTRKAGGTHPTGMFSS